MKIEACIFDLDGVIVDTAKYHYIAWKEIAKELGFNFTLADNERLKGVSRMTSLEILLEVGGIELSEQKKLELAEKKNTRYLEYVEKIKPGEILPGTLELLSELGTNHIKIALGSASKNAMAILNRLEITDLFDAIIDGNKVSVAKPNPEVFLKGAAALGVTPAACIVFEDAQAGIEAAINGGMLPIGIGKEGTLKNARMVVSGLNKITCKKLKNIFED